MAAVKQTSHQLIASTKQQVTIIPLTIGSIVRRSLVSILGIREIPFLGKIEKKDGDSRVSLTSLIVTDLERKLLRKKHMN